MVIRAAIDMRAGRYGLNRFVDVGLGSRAGLPRRRQDGLFLGGEAGLIRYKTAWLGVIGDRRILGGIAPFTKL